MQLLMVQNTTEQCTDINIEKLSSKDQAGDAVG